MRVEAVERKRKQSGKQNEVAIVSSLLLPASSPSPAPARAKAGSQFDPSCSFLPNLLGLLTLLSVLVETRRLLLEAPICGSALQKVKQIRERKRLLAQVDTLITLVLRVLLLATPSIKRKRLRLQRKIANFWALVVQITKRSKIQLNSIEQWIMRLWERLNELRRLRNFEKQTNKLIACEISALLSRAPPEREKPFDAPSFVATSFISPATPRVVRVPTALSRVAG